MLILLLGCLHRPTTPDPLTALQARHAAEIATMWSMVSPDAPVEQRLGAMVQIDQRVRRLSPDGLPDEAVPAAEEWIATQIKETTARTTATLSEIVAEHGWPRRSTFGSQAAHDAWLLVQHADQQPDFQAQVLAEMAPLLIHGEVSPSDYASLTDRVERNAGRPQRYGTQGRCTGPGVWSPEPLADPEGVEEARALVGLGPMADQHALCWEGPVLPAVCAGVTLLITQEDELMLVRETPEGLVPVVFESPAQAEAFYTECVD